MRITQEADYALRIVCLLAEQGKLMDAGTIAEEACVSQRFALKILRKLVLGNLVCSQKGAGGGYRLGKKPEEISMKDIIELIDGEITISRCLSDGQACSREGQHKSGCVAHRVFDAINRDVVEKLNKVTISLLTDTRISAEDILRSL